MTEEKEKWIKEVFDSLQGSQRAKPADDLFARIEREINAGAKIIPIYQWRAAAAAAAAILCLNIFAMQQYVQNNATDNKELMANGVADQQLISNFNIYE